MDRDNRWIGTMGGAVEEEKENLNSIIKVSTLIRRQVCFTAVTLTIARCGHPHNTHCFMMVFVNMTEKR